jgi:hypothetical protein
MYYLRGHGRTHNKLYPFDFRHVKIQIFLLARPNFWV